MTTSSEVLSLAKTNQLRPGDLLFQNFPPSGLTKVIGDATDSSIHHVGILDRVHGKWVVVESVGNHGKLTPLESFVTRGSDVWVKRFTNMTPTKAQKFAKNAFDLTQTYPEYDMAYKYDNDRLYCSELVLLAAQTVGINLYGVDTKAKWLDRSDRSVKEYLQTVHGIGENDPIPDSWRLITPVALFYANPLGDPDGIRGKNIPNDPVPNHALYDTLPGKTTAEKFNFLHNMWFRYLNQVRCESDLAQGGQRKYCSLAMANQHYSLTLFTQFPEEAELAAKISTILAQ